MGAEVIRGWVSRALLGGALLGGAGCDWREFDDVLSRAPVLSVGAGEEYKARDVGKVLLPLTVPASKKGKVAARFLVAGTETPSLAVVELDPAGRPRTHVASGIEIMDMAGEAKAAVKSAVELEDGRVLLGTPSYNLNPLLAAVGRTYVLQLVDAADDVEFKLTRGGEPGTRLSYGLGVAVGKIGGGPTQDLVVASQLDVALAEDGNDAAALIGPAPGCALNLDDVAQERFKFRALGVGDLLDGGGEEIAVGVPRENTMPGRVVILSRGATALDCSVTLEGPGKQPRFGNSVLVADLTGDGKKDLLVGAPPLRAYLFPGPFSAAGAAGPVREFRHPRLMDNEALGEFGFRVGAMDIDGMGGPEVLVSAPDLPVDGTLGAGQVFVFKVDGTAVTEIDDNSPDANAQFGFSIGSIAFSPGTGCGNERSVLLVGADREVFTFFRLPGGPADPRCFR